MILKHCQCFSLLLSKVRHDETFIARVQSPIPPQPFLFCGVIADKVYNTENLLLLGYIRWRLTSEHILKCMQAQYVSNEKYYSKKYTNIPFILSVECNFINGIGLLLWETDDLLFLRGRPMTVWFDPFGRPRFLMIFGAVIPTITIITYRLFLK